MANTLNTEEFAVAAYATLSIVATLLEGEDRESVNSILSKAPTGVTLDGSVLSLAALINAAGNTEL